MGNLGLHSLIIKTDGSLWTFGRNTYGQLETGAARIEELQLRFIFRGRSSIFRAMLVPYYQDRWKPMDFLENAEGNLVMEPRYATILQLKILPSGVSQVSAGYSHSVILKTDGSVWTVGQTNNGQLGDGTTTNPDTH